MVANWQRMRRWEVRQFHVFCYQYKRTIILESRLGSSHTLPFDGKSFTDTQNVPKQFTARHVIHGRHYQSNFIYCSNLQFHHWEGSHIFWLRIFQIRYQHGGIYLEMLKHYECGATNDSKWWIYHFNYFFRVTYLQWNRYHKQMDSWFSCRPHRCSYNNLAWPTLCTMTWNLDNLRRYFGHPY